MNLFKGLEYRKFDLHVHTPASFDFEDKSVTPDDVVKKALSSGLKGIAITDHNTGEWIDKVKKAATGTSLTVFPGVEICCTGGKSGIHVVVILDTDKSTKHITAILSKLDINPDDVGKKNVVTKKSPYDVIDVISASEFNGIAILAHCTSSKGVLHDITGMVRTKIFENTELYAVETSEDDFRSDEKEKQRKRVVDLLNGTDPNYCNRKIAVIISSDSKDLSTQKHKVEGIGSKYTYLKTDDNVTIESLRQCFLDRDVRVRQYFEEISTKYPYIQSVSISGGFFEGQTAIFHKGLNSILGGKGSGKSLLVELMRFAFLRPSAQELIKNDHERKLEVRLEQYGKVEVNFVDETGTEQKIVRIYDPTDGSIYDDSEQTTTAESFDALFLSQNEIVKIAEDEKAQLDFIDQFFDFRRFKYSIESIEKELGHLDRLFANCLRSTVTLTDIEKELDKRNKELEKLDRILSDKTYDSFKQSERKKKALKNQKIDLEEIKQEIETQKEFFEGKESPEIPKELESDPLVRRRQKKIESVIEFVIEKYREIEKQLETVIIEFEGDIKKWKNEYLKEKRAYQEYIRKSGGDKKDIEKRRQKVARLVADLEQRKKTAKSEKKKLKTINRQREQKIKELIGVYAEYSEERRAKCKKFERESNGRLRIALHESSNVDSFKEKLRSLKRGSYLRDIEIEDICSKTNPYEFIINILRYNASQKSDPLKKIHEVTGISVERVKTLFDFLLGQFDYEELLKLQYIALPQDRPEITFKVSENEYQLIRDISVGQKCTAMLIMALSDGRFPIVIDQPEDSLDVRTVWEDMCEKLRVGKEKRQFIFTTHNSSLAVASDSDKFTVVESDAHKGRITYSGSLDTRVVRNEAIKYLEGGDQTYTTKAKKYGYQSKI